MGLQDDIRRQREEQDRAEREREQWVNSGVQPSDFPIVNPPASIREWVFEALPLLKYTTEAYVGIGPDGVRRLNLGRRVPVTLSPKELRRLPSWQRNNLGWTTEYNVTCAAIQVGSHGKEQPNLSCYVLRDGTGVFPVSEEGRGSTVHPQTFHRDLVKLLSQ